MAIIEKLIFFGIACLAETVIGGMVHLGGQPNNGAYPKRWLRCAGNALEKRAWMVVPSTSLHFFNSWILGIV